MQQVGNPTSIHDGECFIAGLALGQGSVVAASCEVGRGFGVAVAVVQAGSCNSDSTSSLGVSIMLWVRSKKKGGGGISENFASRFSKCCVFFTLRPHLDLE